jgi:hypothetical protein
MRDQFRVCFEQSLADGRDERAQERFSLVLVESCTGKANVPLCADPSDCWLLCAFAEYLRRISERTCDFWFVFFQLRASW